MPETISEGARASLIATLESALQIAASARTSLNDAAAITHSAADGHQLTEVMLQQMHAAEGHMDNCRASIDDAIAAIENIPLDPPPDD
jgi:hypothetical protein